MTEINKADVVKELTELYLKYEEALCTNDIETLDFLFWSSSETVRFGVAENLYGIEEIRGFRNKRSPANLNREISHLKVVTFDEDMAAVTLEFHRFTNGISRHGRQSQMWRKFPEGWKIVSAHVSILPIEN